MLTVKYNYENYYIYGDSEWRRLCAIDKTNNIINLCSAVPHNSIIEIGAGEGSIIKRLSEVGFGDKLFALEISKSGVNAIQNKKISRLVECRLFDGNVIPYGDKSFDIAILSHVIEHVEFPRQILYEARRVARYVFVEVPLEDTLRMSADFVMDSVGHINFYSAKTIRRLVQSCNMDVLNQVVTNQSKSIFFYLKGWRGILEYYIKKYFLLFFPSKASLLFTYHSSLICKERYGEDKCE